MKKWPILVVTVIALALYGVFLWYWFDNKPASEPQPAEQTQAVVQTTAQTEPTETMATEPTTVATEATLPQFEAPDESLLNARHVFVYDLTYEQMLYTYGDQNDQVCPASLTKLMTCYVALQYLDGDTVVEVGEEAGWIAKDSSVAAIRQGNRLTVEMIVQGTMMQSGNDGAYALAVAAGRAIAGDGQMDAKTALATFMAEMNAQAQSLGLTGTHFVTPDGYDAEGHYTTPADLFAIARLALTEPMIVRFSAMAKDVVTYESGENYTWKNTNWMLRLEDYPELYVPEAIGLKTGGTSKAGQCVIAVFADGDRQLLIGVLGCEKIEQRFEDASYLFDHYRLTPRTYFFEEEVDDGETANAA